jgi:2'-5' RNA ligase
MRLFVAVEIGPDVAEAAGVVIDELRRRAVRLAPRARITWVSPDRLHLTVAFIGDADEDRAARIGEVLRADVPAEPFSLTVSGLGAFPKTGQPRVLWAGLTQGRDALLGIERVVAARLAEAGIAPEPRAYNPHLTLARVRDAGGLRAGALLNGLGDDPIGTTAVEAITLFDSRLSSKGPTYVPLQRTVVRPA